jgi:hypothetical protein
MRDGVVSALVAWVLSGLLAVTGVTATAGRAPSGLAYATASGHVVQRQTGGRLVPR